MQPVYCQEPSLHSYIHPACWTHDEQGKQDNLTLPHSHVTAKNETFNNTECKLVTTARSDGMGAKFNQEDREREAEILSKPTPPVYTSDTFILAL